MTLNNFSFCCCSFALQKIIRFIYLLHSNVNVFISPIGCHRMCPVTSHFAAKLSTSTSIYWKSKNVSTEKKVQTVSKIYLCCKWEIAFFTPITEKIFSVNFLFSSEKSGKSFLFCAIQFLHFEFR